MSESTHLSRYRPAVIAVTGIAAAYGIYTIYSSITQRPAKRTLHRSNAVHRHRRGPPEILFARPIDATDGTPLGTLTFSRTGRNVGSMVIGRDKLDSAEALQEQYGCDGEAFRAAVARMATWGMLLSCCQATLIMHGTLSEEVTALGLGSLAAIITTPEMDDVAFSAHQDVISGIIGGVDSQIIQDTVERFRELYFNQARSHVYLLPPNPDEVDIAETDDYMTDGVDAEPSQGLKGLLYHIAEENAKRSAYEHRGIRCEECSESPIRNIRWHCLNCPDFDLCSVCEASTEHPKTHVFVKIKIPLPVLSQPSKPHPLWYPGNPQKLHRPISPALRKRFAARYEFDEPELDALYDQFTCIANVPYEHDRDGVRAGIDRRAFDKALTCETWPNRFAPNALYDRMFAFYDTTDKGLISFEDFVSGLAYLRGPNRFQPLDRTLRGYDTDGNGFIDRNDCLRLFRAKYAVLKQLTLDAVQGSVAEHTQAAMDVLRSSQPISSIFASEEIPRGEQRPILGKRLNEVLDMERYHDTKTILNDDDGLPDSAALERRNIALVDGENGNPEGLVLGANDMTSEEAQILGLVRSEAPRKRNDVAKRDVICQIVDASFNVMLDSLFKIPERLHEQVLATQEERKLWHVAIEETLAEKKTFREDLQNGAAIDPLMATAAESYNKQSSRTPPVLPSVEPHMRENMVPTDSSTLERLETDILNQPLSELLSASGYTVAEPSEQAEQPLRIHSEVTHPAPRNGIPRARVTISEGSTGNHEHVDPTLPQNRPNGATSPQSGSAHSASGHNEQVPEVFRVLGFVNDDIFKLLDKAPLIEDAGKPQVTEIWQRWLESHPKHSLNEWRYFYRIVVRPRYLQRIDTKDTPGSQSSHGSGAENAVDPGRRPDKSRLEYLANLEEEVLVVNTRGGPGRLSYDEIEGMVDADTTRELRGLLTSWLEFASF